MSEETNNTSLQKMHRFASLVVRRWWLLLICVAVALSATWVILKKQTPVYRATSKVVVGIAAPRVMVGIQEVMEVLDAPATRRYREYLNSQLDIMKSYRVATQVLDDLDLWDNEALFGKPAEKTDLTTDQLRLQRAASLSERIKTKASPDSMIVEISFESTDPDLAAKLATQIATVYRDQNLSQKKKLAANAGVDLEAANQQHKEAKKKAEEAIKAFRARIKVGVIPTRKKAAEDRVGLLNLKHQEATNRRISFEAEQKQLDKVRRRGPLGVSAPQILENPVITELKLHYVRQQSELTSIAEIYGPKHPKRITAKKQLSKLVSALRQEINAVFESVELKAKKAQEEEFALTVELKLAEREEDEIATVVEEHEKLKAELVEANALYDRVRKRHQDTELSRDLATNNIRLLNPALVPRTPVRPNRPMALTLGAILGLCIGIVLALLLETADTSIRGKEQAEKAAGVQCLGLIPGINVPTHLAGVEQRRHRDLYVHTHPMSETAEMGRALRTNLQFLSAQRRLRRLLVTSPLPQEGKTTVAVQVSTTLASVGPRVILIEADMRRPRLAGTFKANPKIGLSNYLADPNAKLSELIQPSEVPNMDVLVCGPCPPNPAELLNSDRVEQLLLELGEIYDTVVLDSPPVNAVADALILTRNVDGVLLVAKSQQTTQEALREASQALESVEAPVLGVVVNDIREGHGGYYYRRGYYRGRYYRAEHRSSSDRPPLEVVKS